MATITRISNYVQLAGKTASDVTSSWQDWTAFLKTAARLYRYSFTDQLLIHAQNPTASACADYDTWYRRMRWYVKRGSKGIALVDVQSDGRPNLRYVFDIKNTGRNRDSYNLYIWQYNEENHQGIVTKALEKRYGVPGNDGIYVQIAHIATQLAKSYWKNYKQEIRASADGSSLGELDEHNLRIRFSGMAACSITYMVLSRCGLHPEQHLSSDPFCSITDYNTQRIIKTLGCVVNPSGGEILHLIAIAIIAYEREKKSVRTSNPEQARSNVSTGAENHK